MKTLRLKLAGFLLLLLLLIPATVLGAPQESPPTPTPDYDYNPTFDYSYFSNVTGDDYDNFTDGPQPTGASDPQQTPAPPDQPSSSPPNLNRPPAPTIAEEGGASASGATSLAISTGSRALLVSFILIITRLQHAG